MAVYTPYPPDHSLEVLRVFGPLARAGIEILPGVAEGQVDVECIVHADLVLVQRDFPRTLADYERVIARAHAEAKPVVYEVDDLLLELPAEHPDRGIHYYTPALLPMLLAAMQAQVVLTSTKPLRDRYRLLNPNTHLYPNLLNDELWVRQELKPAVSRTPVIIGYFGSDTHAPDVEEIAPALGEVLRRYPEAVELRFFGCPPPDSLRTHPRVQATGLRLPYTEYVEFVLAQVVDIGLAPLRNTPFNQAKSAIKFLEYSAAGIPGVYSAVVPYRSIVRHGHTGLLADTPASWVRSLGRLIEQPSLRERIRREAHEEVVARWSLSRHARLWPDTVRQALRQAPDIAREDVRRLEMIAAITHQIDGWAHALTLANQEDEAAINVLARQAAEKEQLVLSISRELEALKGSTGYRLLRMLWSLRLWAVPRGSLRERVLRLALRATRVRKARDSA